MTVFKRIRVTILLIILAIVAVSTYLQIHHAASWDKPLRLTIYPINGDNSETTDRYINTLSIADFAPINQFMESEADAYNIALRPLFLPAMGAVIKQLPPRPPGDRSDKLKMIVWSLELRYWLVKNVSTLGLDARHIRIFVAYHKGFKDKPLEHSYGLQKGLLGVVNAYASEKQSGQNNVVIAHELLHILGASDKYDRKNLPIFPAGYAEPDKAPLFPQEFAELMGGRIPETPDKAAIPTSLDDCLIGPITAGEINWLSPEPN